MRLGRRHTAAAALAAAILALSACSSDDDSDEPDPAGSATAGPTAASGGPGTPAALGPVPPAAAPGAGGSYYVALGDSYAAGVRIPETIPDAPAVCSRSASNYPHLTARTLAVPTFTDATCGGATTEDLAAPQSGSGSGPAPQYDALGPQTRLVTLGIGGNDIGFTEIVTTCVLKNGDTSSPTPCKDAYTKDGQDVLAQRIQATAGKIDAALTTIHEKSPQARVLLVGYPAILPETGDGCPAHLPVAAGDLGYLRGVLTALNTMLAERAAAGNATYVDTYAPAVGHDVCTPSGTKWIEGIKPESPAAQVHPNALGHQGMAAVVIAAAQQI